MDKLIKELRDKYQDTRFVLKEDDYFKIVLFNSENLKENEDFFEFIYELAEKYLDDETKIKFSVVFDYLDEIHLYEKQTLNEYEKEFYDEIRIKTEITNTSSHTINLTSDFNIESSHQILKRYSGKTKDFTNKIDFMKTTFTNMKTINSRDNHILNTPKPDIFYSSNFNMNRDTIRRVVH